MEALIAMKDAMDKKLQSRSLIPESKLLNNASDDILNARMKGISQIWRTPIKQAHIPKVSDHYVVKQIKADLEGERPATDKQNSLNQNGAFLIPRMISPNQRKLGKYIRPQRSTKFLWRTKLQRKFVMILGLQKMVSHTNRKEEASAKLILKSIFHCQLVKSLSIRTKAVFLQYQMDDSISC
ncbi:hypothetical protein Tco_0803245 [Tanacetum coccineum]|uniref:Reverse transcriptase n=1 Tax=Tanacetum coccineum TaxID=301880 RepID=A0ABQ5A4P1_9ASTR